MNGDFLETAGYVAANRFGYGPRPGEIDVISKDPKAWLKDQLETIDQIPLAMQNLPASQTMLVKEGAWRQERRAMARSADEQTLMDRQRNNRRESIRLSREQLRTRLQVAIETEQPFAERLLRFWSNHFTVAVSGGQKAVLRTIAVPYENEAIRSNLAADFTSMLMAVEQHPAMLIYLDNDNSIGPNSDIGRRRDRGLNENLAREILELHTLSVKGGYTQTDVTSLAKMITGWTVTWQRSNRPRAANQNPGKFRFTQPMHEPGTHVLMGKNYKGNGVRQGENALKFLAQHPATARHVATKLVTHFVADEPPLAAIARIENVFIESGGSLPAIHEALVDLDEAWQPQFKKLKTPEEYIVSIARAMSTNSSDGRDLRAYNSMSQALTGFNQVPFTANSPAGWPDDADHWGSPDALLKRIEWANEIAEHSSNRLNPLDLYAAIMPENEQLKLAITRAESRNQGLALLFASPDFQWR